MKSSFVKKNHIFTTTKNIPIKKKRINRKHSLHYGSKEIPHIDVNSVSATGLIKILALLSEKVLILKWYL